MSHTHPTLKEGWSDSDAGCSTGACSALVAMEHRWRRRAGGVGTCIPHNELGDLEVLVLECDVARHLAGCISRGSIRCRFKQELRAPWCTNLSSNMQRRLATGTVACVDSLATSIEEEREDIDGAITVVGNRNVCRCPPAPVRCQWVCVVL